MEASRPYRPGMVIGGKFVLLRLIAEGATGVVFEAKDTFIQRHVAIKLLLPKFVHNADIVRRFRREAEATACVQHPNVVTVLEMGQRRDGSFYIVQELLQGNDLRLHIAERQRFRVDEALEILLPVMGALCAAHSHGIIHRDVKPDNIVLTRSPSGEVVPKLVDFGIAKLYSSGSSHADTQVGSLLGTIAYMSPEQVRGMHPLDARTDVWAMAVVLFELLSGSCPFNGPNMQSTILRIVTEPVPLLERAVPGVSERLAAIVHRALEQNLERRLPTMQAFRQELLDFATGNGRTMSPAPAINVSRNVAPVPAPASREQVAKAPRPPPRVSTPEDAFHSSGEVARVEFDELWLDPDDLVLDEESTSQGTAQEDGAQEDADLGATRVRPAAPAEVEQKRVSQPHDEIDWLEDRPSLMPKARGESDVEAAESALGVNRLQEAITLAERAVAVGSPELSGRMWLVQAIAHRWLGNYGASEYCAMEASKRLAHGSGGWYAAIGYFVIASGYMGKAKQVLSSFEEVKRVEVTEEKVNLHVIALCRLAIFLMRGGYPNVAQRILLDAEGLIGGDDAIDAIVRAWVAAARAEAAMYQGDLTSYLRRVEASVEGFTSAGDVRNACLQRANIGNAYMQLGAYRRAAAVLRETLNVAEPMKLDFVPHVKVNLGFVLAQLGQLDQAIEVERAALDDCIAQRHSRFEGCSRIYLATMYSMRGEMELATRVAQQAVELFEGMTDMRAYALATLARMMHIQKQAALAFRYAREAMDLMRNLGGVEEGESLIRTVYALALRATGNEPEGRREIAEARKRLHERASRIGDAHWRQSFLEVVRDNARVMNLAAQWLDGGRVDQAL